MQVEPYIKRGHVLVLFGPANLDHIEPKGTTTTTASKKKKKKNTLMCHLAELEPDRRQRQAEIRLGGSLLQSVIIGSGGAKPEARTVSVIS